MTPAALGRMQRSMERVVQVTEAGCAQVDVERANLITKRRPVFDERVGALSVALKTVRDSAGISLWNE